VTTLLKGLLLLKEMSSIGGQALIEGVMMISDEKVAMAARKPDGRIVTKKENRHHLTVRYKKIPLVRGALALWEMLSLGMKGLMWSSEQAEEQEEKTSGFAMTLTVLFSFLVGIALFIALPFYIARLATENHFLFNLIDGVLRVAVFLAYLLVISRMKDVRRLFQYHGAEHMAVHCNEHKKKLTVGNVEKFTTLHPRCGTAFLFLVLLVSILVFTLVYSSNWIIKFFLRILLIPVIAAVSYEILKFSAKHQDNLFFRSLIKPGLWFQMITTKKPDRKQIEVAITALKAVLRP